MSCTKNSLRWCMRRSKYKSLLLVTGALLIIYFIQAPLYMLYLYLTSQNITDFELQGEKSVSLRKSEKTDSLLERIVHLDFKGAPPKIEYILNLIPHIKEMGATGILIEYEDTFPYHDDIEEISALNAYTLSDVYAIIKAAEKNNLTLTPLIPTLSHLEFVLKLEKYRAFREVDYSPETICPTHYEVYKVLEKMIDQILEVHNKSKYLHIGCDEVVLLGVCPRCKSVVKEGNLKKNDIFLGHVKRIAEYISEHHPTVRTLMWGNGLLKYELSSLSYSGLPSLVDIMLYNYKIDYDSFPATMEMRFFAKVFPKIWVASSYKGTLGIGQIVTDIDLHLINFRLWMDFIEQWKAKIDFKGIVLTGLQRYTHFDVLSELLPVSVPSMAIILSIQNVEDFDYEIVKQSLSCNEFVPLNAKEFLNMNQLEALHCDFPGFEVYRLIHYFFNAMVTAKELLVSVDREGLSFYNVLHSEWRPSSVSVLGMKKYKDHLLKIIKLEKAIKVALSKIYNNHTVNEWIATHVFPLRMHLEMVVAVTDPLINKKIWSRRPLLNDLSLFETTFKTFCHENGTLGCRLFFSRIT